MSEAQSMANILNRFEKNCRDTEDGYFYKCVANELERLSKENEELKDDRDDSLGKWNQIKSVMDENVELNDVVKGLINDRNDRNDLRKAISSARSFLITLDEEIIPVGGGESIGYGSSQLKGQLIMNKILKNAGIRILTSILMLFMAILMPIFCVFCAMWVLTPFCKVMQEEVIE